jgi:integrase
MKFSVVYWPSVPASTSPYRVLDEHGREVAWANTFLDAQRVRQLSLRSLRAYAYDLLHFARGWAERQPLSKTTESTLLNYARHQLDQQPKPAPQTINHRLDVLRCLFRFHYGHEIPAGQSHFQRPYTTRSPLGYGRPRRVLALGLRLRQPRRVIVPLCAEEVAKFWRSFRTFRDLALVGLMLLDGLRSCEILALQLENLQLADAQMRVGFSAISMTLSRNSAAWRNSAVILICWAGSVACVNKIRPYATRPVDSTGSSSAICWRIWPPTATTSSPT